MPSNTAAWLQAAKANPLVVKEAPYVSPGSKELVVKNSAVAINPVDWKIQDYDIFVQAYPFILGCDVAGTVAEVGADVKDFKVGDRVFSHALSLLSGRSENGGFQAYTVVSEVLTGHLPDNITFEQGSVLPLGINTAAAGLFQDDYLALKLPTLDAKPNGQTLVIWGGSSSVGACGIQLAKAAGYEVFATASKRSHQFCKDLGADQVFDYNESNVVDSIVKALNGKDVVGVYDSISLEPTVQACTEISKKAGGVQTVACTLPDSDKYEKNAPGVAVKSVFAPTVQYNKVGPALWGDYLTKALKAGSFKPKPDPQVIGKGLESIQKGCDANKAGVSASKVVVTL